MAPDFAALYPGYKLNPCQIPVLYPNKEQHFPSGAHGAAYGCARFLHTPACRERICYTATGITHVDT
jgi:hypothetical protein